MELFLWIVVIVFAAFAAVAVFVIVRSLKKPKMSREIHFVNGADIERGYVSTDNNFFKGVPGEMDETRLLGTDHRTGKMRRITVKFVNLRTGKTDVIDLYDQIIIGRSPGPNGFTIESDPSISKQHCMIFANEGRLYLMDMKSVNHTYLNSNLITDTVPLMPNDIIKIGSTQLSVRY